MYSRYPSVSTELNAWIGRKSLSLGDLKVRFENYILTIPNNERKGNDPELF
jgi:hypothetical protein